MKKPRDPRKPWEIAEEREARDKRMNADPDVLRFVNAEKVKHDDQWWADILKEAQKADRWVYPYAYDLFTTNGEKNSGAA